MYNRWIIIKDLEGRQVAAFDLGDHPDHGLDLMAAIDYCLDCQYKLWHIGFN